MVKFAIALLTCCGSSSLMACMTTFNSSVVIGFGWSIWYFSSLGRYSPAVLNLEFFFFFFWGGGHLFISINTVQFAEVCFVV